MSYILDDWLGKRGVCVINGEIFGCGEDIPDEKLIPATHPFGDTNNQPYLGDDSIGGGVELEAAHPKTQFVPVILRHDKYPFTLDDYPVSHTASKAKYRSDKYPEKEDWISTGKKVGNSEYWGEPYMYYDDAWFVAEVMGYNFGFVKIITVKVT